MNIMNKTIILLQAKVLNAAATEEDDDYQKWGFISPSRLLLINKLCIIK